MEGIKWSDQVEGIRWKVSGTLISMVSNGVPGIRSGVLVIMCVTCSNIHPHTIATQVEDTRMCNMCARVH